ncbi:helix-turn-helix transcriptional regulator [Spirulina sp. 06S082]|uniref:helix-turn-helix domain-containing protein n=1 Tax=Spirulina sp. 06S082 TaxID=3110248 RepID=UPI002B1E9FAB|nr:helix-turn-helix transcriptional regulator [Spirulina sp. 06S082]MEA5467445.1 helix-turn-helix transcriptional regulator [Spirulina sp. 06S082]
MEERILIQFGKCLQSQRVARGLSQEQLAELIDVDRTYISFLERGKRNPSLKLLNLLCIALDISLTEFFQKIDDLEKAKNE